MRAHVISFLLMLLPLVVLSSSMVFELQGNVYPIGHFYVTMSIGEPAKPYFLDIDTGSELTWLECDAPRQSTHKVPHELYRPRPSNKVLCEDQRCVAMHWDLGIVHDCTMNPNQCDYVLGYVGAEADNAGESSLGALMADKFSLPTTNERLNFALGCGYDQEGGLDKRPVDGVLGIGRGRMDFVSQLKQQGMIAENVVGHCLGIHGGGFLFFGRDSDRIPSAGVTWLPMIYYSPGRSTLNLEVQQEYPVSVTPMDAVFDSGSTYSYVHMETYARLIWAVDITLQGSSLQVVTDPALPLCWRRNEPIQSVDDVKNDFRPLEWSFAHGNNQATVEIPPENYIIVSEGGNVCLGILNGSAHGINDYNIIGDIMMQNHVVIYDNVRSQIGWARASCDEFPGPQPLIGSRL